MTLTSNEMAGITEWEVLSESSVGSDHYPIIIKVGEEDMKCQDGKLIKLIGGYSKHCVEIDLSGYIKRDGQMYSRYFE